MGISPNNISFGYVTMESDKYIVVRETVGDSSQAVVINVANPTDILRKPISADSVMMHPVSRILALKCFFISFVLKNPLFFSG